MRSAAPGTAAVVGEGLGTREQPPAAGGCTCRLRSPEASGDDGGGVPGLPDAVRHRRAAARCRRRVRTAGPTFSPARTSRDRRRVGRSTRCGSGFARLPSPSRCSTLIGAFQALSTASRRQSPTSPAEPLRGRYWKHIVAVDPLDACTLGAATACGQLLPDLRNRARQERTAFEQAVLEELDRLPLDDLPDQLAMDMVAIRRLAEHWVVGASRHAQLGNLEYAENLPTLIVLQAGQARSEVDWRRVVQRLLGVEVLLRRQQQTLETAVDVGYAPDYVETLRVVEHVVPGTASMLDEVLSARAAEEDLSAELVSALDRASASATGALHAHGRFLEQLAERLPRNWRPPGEAETARRLARDGFGDDPRALFEESMVWIDAEQQRFVARARAAGLDAPTFTAAVESWNARLADPPKNAATAIQIYRDRVDRLNAAAINPLLRPK